MKRFISLAFLIAAISFLSVTTAKSQEDPFKKCQSQISSAFVINSQPLQAFLTGDEVAEFRTTFLSGVFIAFQLVLAKVNLFYFLYTMLIEIFYFQTKIIKIQMFGTLKWQDQLNVLLRLN